MRWTRRQLLISTAAGAFSAAVATGAYAWRLEPDRVGLTRLTLELPGWPAELDGLRIGQITDVHCDCPRAVERTRRAARLLMQGRPDVVFLTGDYVTSHGEQWAEPAADALAPVVAARLGAIAILGNHDHWTHSADILARELGRIGIPVLRNEALHVPARTSFWVLGVDSIATGAADATVAAIGVPRDVAKIMLVHEPDFADYAGVSVALQLSGHSHGGQVRLPGLGVHTPEGARKYRYGFYPNAPSPVFVSRGVGTIGPPVRFLCPPEVVVLTLRQAPAELDGAGKRTNAWKKP